AARTVGTLRTPCNSARGSRATPRSARRAARATRARSGFPPAIASAVARARRASAASAAAAKTRLGGNDESWSLRARHDETARHSEPCPRLLESLQAGSVTPLTSVCNTRPRDDHRPFRSEPALRTAARERHGAQRAPRLPTRRWAAAIAVVARFPANARDLAPRGRASRAAVHARAAGSARLRRLGQARRRSGSLELQQAHHGARRSRDHAHARLRALLRLRPRPRRPRRTPPGARRAGGRARAAAARHLAHAHDVRAYDDGVRAGLLPLVLLDSAGTAAGAPDRRRSALLSAYEARRLGLARHRAVRRARARRIRTVFREPRRDPRD